MDQRGVNLSKLLLYLGVLMDFFKFEFLRIGFDEIQDGQMVQTGRLRDIHIYSIFRFQLT